MINRVQVISQVKDRAMVSGAKGVMARVNDRAMVSGAKGVIARVNVAKLRAIVRAKIRMMVRATSFQTNLPINAKLWKTLARFLFGRGKERIQIYLEIAGISAIFSKFHASLAGNVAAVNKRLLNMVAANNLHLNGLKIRAGAMYNSQYITSLTRSLA